MAMIKYQNFNFRPKSLEIIKQANHIINEYETQGYELTLRQLYYQFVARGIIPNSDREYKKLGSVVNNGRLAGLIDWEAITDRTRPSRGNNHWDSPQDIIEACANQFRIDTRADQDCYVEVWVEKDALLGIVEQICTKLDVPYFSCRGYVSQSSMWEAAQRFTREEESRETILIHLGDHDPSGVDMSRDIQSRLNMFGATVEVERIALLMDQIDKYNPPPNPAKITDSRCQGYIDNYGEESWELDALEPQVITELISDAVANYTHFARWEKQKKIQTNHRKDMKKVVADWPNIIAKIKRKI